MLFQRINRSDPEKIFIVVKAEGETVLVDRPCSFTFTGTDDGLLVEKCDAVHNVTIVAGLADAAIADGNYGLVQVYGFRSSAVCIAATSMS